MHKPYFPLLLTVIAVATNVVAQTGWVQQLPATRPPARAYHSLTYDAIRGVTVLFGGTSSSSGLGDTWDWNGANWIQRVTPTAPPARFAHAFAHDIGRLRVVLFGGTSCSLCADLNDTWEFDGSNWTQRQPATQPSPRRFARMAYDVARSQIVQFGGGSGILAPQLFDETWVWDGVNWTIRNPASSPSPRMGHSMSYDFARDRIVLFGGSSNVAQGLTNDTWVWDGTNWSQTTATAPTAASGFGLASDTGRDLVVRFGGHPNGAETWLYDHIAWRQDTRTPSPSQRAWCSMAHDLLRGKTVLFGGISGLIDFDETWEYDPGSVARWTAYGSGCSGTAGVPTLQPVGASLPIPGASFDLELLNVPSNAAAISFGFSSQTWSGNPLPFDLGTLGMTGCMLYASPDVMFFTPATAGRATLAWQLPNDPGLIGVRFYNQGFVLDPGINPTGATVSNAVAGIIGPF